MSGTEPIFDDGAADDSAADHTAADHTSADHSAAETVVAHRTRLLDAMLDAVLLVDPAGPVVVDANAAAAALLASPGVALVGRSVLEFLPTPEDRCFWDDVAAGLADQIESNTLLAAADGRLREVTRRVSPTPGPAGTALFVVALRDRTEHEEARRALEATAAELRATLESAHDGILVTDLFGRIRNFNRRFAELWQLPPALVDSRDDDAVFDWMRRSVTHPSAYMRRLATIDGMTSLRSVDAIWLRSGTVLERVTAPQRLNGQPIGRISTFRDITGQPEARLRSGQPG